MSRSDWCNIRVSIPYRGKEVFHDTCEWLDDNIRVTDYEFKGIDNLNHENRLYYFALKQDAVRFSLRWL